MADELDRALVLAGGGVGGIAWLVGFAAGLARLGVDLTDADVMIGTSAGAAVAAQLATGQLAAAARMQLSEQTAELSVDFDMESFFEQMTVALEQASDRRDASRRVAELPLVNTSATADQRRAAVAARLPVTQWPDQALRVVAVARDTGERVVFDRTSGVTLLDAVLASCAVPGVWRPVAIGGARVRRRGSALVRQRRSRRRGAAHARAGAGPRPTADPATARRGGRLTAPGRRPG